MSTSTAENLQLARVSAAAGHCESGIEAFARVAGESGYSVLITGETGSGKTHLARKIHEAGPAGRPFVRVNCAAIPDSLFEREMFGHVRGAYTDAREAADGFLEAANGGTLFLDEISELAPNIQPKLLAVLEDGRFRKLGSPREIHVEVQVIAAANRDLTEMVAHKLFRQDLFYRLSVLRCTVPPLREHPDDIAGLAREILRKNRRAGTLPPLLTPETLDVLRGYRWPGNIRELDNVLRAATAFSGGGEIRPEHLPDEVRTSASPPSAAGESCARSDRYSAPREPADEVDLIQRALLHARGNKSEAARSLGMSRSTLWAKLMRYSDLIPQPG